MPLLLAEFPHDGRPGLEVLAASDLQIRTVPATWPALITSRPVERTGTGISQRRQTAIGSSLRHTRS